MRRSPLPILLIKNSQYPRQPFAYTRAPPIRKALM